MRINIQYLISVTIFFTFSHSALFAEAKKVACIGDSITFGAGVKNRGENNYPLQLEKMLGNNYQVKNFGVNGATKLKKGDKPYWKLGAYKAALAFEPDIVVIKLGTNDTKPHNWKHKADYVANYVEMIASFKALKSNPTIWACYPVPAYPGRWGISDKTIKTEVIPLLDKVSKKTKLKIIDLYTALGGIPEFFPDTVHPNAAGAKIIAETVHKAIAAKPAALVPVP